MLSQNFSLQTLSEGIFVVVDSWDFFLDTTPMCGGICNLSKTSGPGESVNHYPLLRSQGLAVDPQWTNFNSPSFQKQWLAEEWAYALWKTIRCWVKYYSFKKLLCFLKGKNITLSHLEIVLSTKWWEFFVCLFVFPLRKYLKKDREEESGKKLKALCN